TGHPWFGPMLEQADLRVIRPEGELDLHSVRGLSAALSGAVGDITHEPFIDSGALAVLAKAAEQLRRQGRVLALVLPPGRVRDLLDLTGLRDRFEILSSMPGNARGSTPGPAARGGRFARGPARSRACGCPAAGRAPPGTSRCAALSAR